MAARQSVLYRLGALCVRHRRITIAAWLIVLAGVGVVAQTGDGRPIDKFSIPGAQSQKALDLLQSQFPAASGTNAKVVFEAPSGTLTEPANQTAINATLAKLKALPNVSTVTGPFDATPTAITGISADGQPEVQSQQLNINEAHTVGYANVQYTTQAQSLDQAKEMVEQLEAAAAPAQEAGLVVNLGGQVVDFGNPAPPGISEYSELIGLAFAIVILLIALGSATSMAVPIGVAILSVAMSHNLVAILEDHFIVGSVAPILGSMIGLGVGIDYSLFILTRYRQGLRDGLVPEAAVGSAMATSGSAVLFAGLTVCMALCGLYFVGIPYVAQLGYVAAMFVAVTITAAMTLLPAVLGWLGPRVNTLALHHRDENADIHKTVSARWAAATSRHPWRYALVALIVLLALAIPVFHIDLGFTDEGNLPAKLTQRKAYDTLTTNFGPGINGPLLLAIDLRGEDLSNKQTVDAGIAALAKLSSALEATPGVARVSLPIPNTIPTADNPKLPTALVMEVVPTSGPNQSSGLVERLRETVIPDALEGTIGKVSDVYVGGPTATLIDLTEAVKSRLALFIGAVILGAFILLMMVFRSLFVPFKAAVMNLLSIVAAYGIIVAVFQWGWGKDAIGLAETVPIVAFVPVMMFAVLFGLSMDYEVFLISRIKEEYVKSGRSRDSVVTGLAATARVITAAALIMISVFLSFVPNPDPTVKMIGLGMAAAVLVDATIVRMVLVPSTMELAGKANWWIPRWLDKILPHISVE